MKVEESCRIIGLADCEIVIFCCVKKIAGYALPVEIKAKRETEMTNTPKNLKYALTHEWASLEDNAIVRVGITDFAQSELGDIVFIGLPDVGRVVKCNEQIAVVESVKTASDLFSPVSGTVVDVNEAVLDEPERVNEDAYATWLFCIEADSPSELEQLMDAESYQRMIEE